RGAHPFLAIRGGVRRATLTGRTPLGAIPPLGAVGIGGGARRSTGLVPMWCAGESGLGERGSSAHSGGIGSGSGEGIGRDDGRSRAPAVSNRGEARADRGLPLVRPRRGRGSPHFAGALGRAAGL